MRLLALRLLGCHVLVAEAALVMLRGGQHGRQRRTRYEPELGAGGLPRVPPAAAPPSTTTLDPSATTLDPALADLMKPPPVTPLQCGQLEAAILLKPSALCRIGEFPSGYDGCVCTIQLPANVNPAPDVMFDPFPEGLELEEPVPAGFPKLKPLDPPTNPLIPYIPPPMAPSCPFSRSCAEVRKMLPADGGGPDAQCVGFDSWGFDEVHQASYAPASGYLNTITCSYMRHPNVNFVLPPAVGMVEANRLHREVALSRYNMTLKLVCQGMAFSGTWSGLCKSVLPFEPPTLPPPERESEPAPAPAPEEAAPAGLRPVPKNDDELPSRFVTVGGHAAKCTTRWMSFFAGRCEEATPPPGTRPESTFAEICPEECESLFAA
eukprot:TRINITY_DN6872_c0_g1_i2.p1 TRINITY_DN6872_c0_g1~~TRINITY_DN6872_c0_g1_i2.p1  ORF type:complete len:378 (-),score=78.45 TRINITY_DN6872_c0_g1_i2:86-1219(-)